MQKSKNGGCITGEMKKDKPLFIQKKNMMFIYTMDPILQNIMKMQKKGVFNLEKQNTLITIFSHKINDRESFDVPNLNIFGKILTRDISI